MLFLLGGWGGGYKGFNFFDLEIWLKCWDRIFVWLDNYGLLILLILFFIILDKNVFNFDYEDDSGLSFFLLSL